MQIAHTQACGNKVVNIYYDPEPLNPRKEYSNPTTMLCWHSRYNLGDSQAYVSKEVLMREYEGSGNKILLIKPLYLLDHSGLSISTSAFGCQWDSGQVGWVFITQSSKDDFIMNPKILNESEAEVMKILDNMLESDVKVYDAYLSGRAYGYEIVGSNGETLESCWGYLDSMDSCLSDALIIANS